ncbi:Acetyl-coenzyme A synthetase [Bienertia sinuspersici]
MEVQVESYSAHHVEANVLDADKNPVWKAIGFYGWADAANKNLSWELMRKLLEQCELPAIVFGDFNEIHYSDEKDGGY